VKDEKAMSSDKKTQTPNKQTKVVTPDALTKTTTKGDIELREEERYRRGVHPIRETHQGRGSELGRAAHAHNRI
jgi:hypothetical protein